MQRGVPGMERLVGALEEGAQAEGDLDGATLFVDEGGGAVIQRGLRLYSTVIGLHSDGTFVLK